MTPRVHAQRPRPLDIDQHARQSEAATNEDETRIIAGVATDAFAKVRNDGVARLTGAADPGQRPLAALTKSGAADDAKQTGETSGRTKQADINALTTAANESGVDVSDMNLDIKPGENFFAYSSGRWQEKTQIPADKSEVSTWTQLDDVMAKRTREVITKAAGRESSKGSERKQVGDYYSAFLDQDAIDKRGLEPVRAIRAKIAKIDSRTALAAAIARQHEEGIRSAFAFYVHNDDRDPTGYRAKLYQNGLTLAGREHYLEQSAEKAELRDKYVKHIVKMLQLAGVPHAEARAQRIFELEKKIAEAHWKAEEAWDPTTTSNNWQTTDFADKAPGFDWRTYFREVGLGKESEMVVHQTTAISGVAKLLGEEPLESWREYLLWRELKSSASVLPRAIAEENFAFDETLINGTPTQPERWKLAIERTKSALPDPVAKLYVDEYFAPDAKRTVTALVEELAAAMRARIEASPWMSDETKAKAKEKLSKMKTLIGHPDAWRDYSSLRVRANDAFGNERRVKRFEHLRTLEKLSRPASRDEWLMSALDVNAGAIVSTNQISFPAAVLQPPFFDPKADPAINYGAIGVVLAHEMVHHFDEQGRQYDGEGRLNDWWKDEDEARFKQLTKALAEQFDAYQVFSDLHVDGQQTLSENVADLSGLAIAFDAYKRSLKGQPAPIINGFTGEQRFFLGYAQAFRAKMTEAKLRNYVDQDEHAPPEQRVSTVRNIDGWYDAFQPEMTDKLYLPKERRITIW